MSHCGEILAKGELQDRSLYVFSSVSQVMLCEQQLALNSELTYRAFSGLAGGHALKHQDWLSARRLTNHLPC
ncbi:unnamed protein product [Fusarium fujikuroi]|nr:uncharacterized protein FFB14_07384 [Fusarium fujikuroi]VTT60711.1 unnamed protein product [Fusarium fujikuroi]VZH93249.1 unnamed protein product [Fusarium fujikuroi]